MVKNFGRLDELLAKDPQALDKLRAQYQNNRQEKKEAAVQVRLEEAERALACAETASSKALPLLHYGHYPLRSLWNDVLKLPPKLARLQEDARITFDVNAAASFLAFTKVLDPASVLFSFSSKDGFLGDPAAEMPLDAFCSTFSFLKTNKDAILKWINQRLDASMGSGRARLVFYDVTNVYFEAPLTDVEMGCAQADFPERFLEFVKQEQACGRLPADCFDEDGEIIPEALPAEFFARLADERIEFLRMRGPSKEHRFDLPIVSIALVIDQNGFPMDFEVYAGNASEFRTMKQSIDNLKAKHGITDAVVVADRGLNSVKNLKMLKEAQLGCLVVQRVTQFDAELEKQMLDLSKYQLINPNNPEAGKYLTIKNWKKSGTNASISCTLALTCNEKRRKRDEAILKVWAEIVKAKQAAGKKLGPRKTGWGSIAKTANAAEQPIADIDQETYDRKLKYCGFAAVVYGTPPESNNHDGKLTGMEIAGAYHQLVRIEECFRIMKTHLGLRPMYVRNSDHIRGHIMTCLLALLLLRLVQHRLDEQQTPLSIPRICRALREATVAVLPKGENDVQFLHAGFTAGVRRGNEHLDTMALIKLAKQSKDKESDIEKIMRACSLTPLSRFMSRAELARCLHARYRTPADAVPPVMLAMMQLQRISNGSPDQPAGAGDLPYLKSRQLLNSGFLETALTARSGRESDCPVFVALAAVLPAE